MIILLVHMRVERPRLPSDVCGVFTVHLLQAANVFYWVLCTDSYTFRVWRVFPTWSVFFFSVSLNWWTMSLPMRCVTTEAISEAVLPNSALQTAFPHIPYTDTALECVKTRCSPNGLVLSRKCWAQRSVTVKAQERWLLAVTCREMDITQTHACMH